MKKPTRRGLAVHTILKSRIILLGSDNNIFSPFVLINVISQLRQDRSRGDI